MAMRNDPLSLNQQEIMKLSQERYEAKANLIRLTQDTRKAEELLSKIDKLNAKIVALGGSLE